MKYAILAINHKCNTENNSFIIRRILIRYANTSIESGKRIYTGVKVIWKDPYFDSKDQHIYHSFIYTFRSDKIIVYDKASRKTKTKQYFSIDDPKEYPELFKYIDKKVIQSYCPNEFECDKDEDALLRLMLD